MSFSTFSIVARDVETGMIGVAGGTNWFNYGRWVPHIEVGVGALATQAETNMSYAKLGLDNLRNGLSAQESLDKTLEEDKDMDGIFQLLMIDSSGNTAAYTGKNNYDYAGHILGQNVAVAGNTLVSKDTFEAVISYFEKSSEEFGLKMIKALRAGHKAGGDIRGMKSAALKIVAGKSSGKVWEDTIYDLRVDESSDPLKELERLYYVANAYNYIGEAEEAESPEQSLEFYKKALELDQNNSEVKFWMARIYYEIGEKVKSDELLGVLGENWKEYWRRLDRRK